jgi:hypothetical protein
VWVVRRDDAVYVRSVNGTSAVWYQGVQTRHEGVLNAGRLQRDVAFVEAGEHADDDRGLDDALDDAYRDKYGRSSSAVARITADVARATTLRLDPLDHLIPDYLNDERDAPWIRTPAPPR